jgi:hypothetical protein
MVAFDTGTWETYRQCTAQLHHYMAPVPMWGILEPVGHVANLCGFRTDLQGNVMPVPGEETPQ